MAASNLAIPVAIVLASVIMATGLYLGLRPPSPPPQPPVTAPLPEPGPPVPVPVPVPVPAAPVAATLEVKAIAAENGRLALETVRAVMVERCWTSAAAKQPEPRQIPLMFNLSFSAQGQLVAFGISETRGADRPDVATCLRLLELRLQIPPPGSPLSVDVPFTLP